MMISRMALCVNRFFEISLHALSGVRVQKVQRVQRVQRGKVLKFDGLSGRGLWYRPAGDAYKVSVTGLALCVIWYKKHYVNQPPPVAFPPFGALWHHLPPRGAVGQ